MSSHACIGNARGNLPAPKAPKPGRLAARDTNRSPERDCGNLRILQIGPTSSRCTVSTPHVRNIGSTWGHHWPTRPQLGPNPDPLDSNFAPTWVQHAATWPQIESVWEQLRPKLRSAWLQNGDMARE